MWLLRILLKKAPNSENSVTGRGTVYSGTVNGSPVKVAVGHTSQVKVTYTSIKVGDVVTLKSGGPQMTVVSTESGLFECVWFDTPQTN